MTDIYSVGLTDILPEEILDLLAWQMSIDWYDGTADISIKRKLVKTLPVFIGIAVHRLPLRRFSRLTLVQVLLKSGLYGNEVGSRNFTHWARPGDSSRPHRLKI